MDNLVNSNKLPFDIRAEVLARLLMEVYGCSTEQILFEPKNYFQRWGRRDVLEVSEGFSYNMDKATILLDVSRESIFDILPEGLFFHPDDEYADDVIRTKKLSEQAATAQKFLLPFEQMFYWMRLENERREFTAENRLEQWWQELLAEDSENSAIFEGYSPLKNSLLNEAQRDTLTHLLPHLPEIIGNWSLTAQWLSLFFEADITITEIPPPQYTFPIALQKRMGAGRLGQDFVIGETFSDGIPILKIAIENLAPEILADFLQEGEKRKLLEEELLPLLLPIETPYEIATKLNKEETFFQIDAMNYQSILGYTTVL